MSAGVWALVKVSPERVAARASGSALSRPAAGGTDVVDDIKILFIIKYLLIYYENSLCMIRNRQQPPRGAPRRKLN
jgi:hypothetical protein